MCFALLTCTPPNFGDDPPVPTGEPLTISPKAASVAAGSQLPFSGTGGTPPYRYTVEAGTGSINLTTGVYTAPPSAGNATIQVKDNDNQTAVTTVVVTPGPLVMTPTYVASVQTNEHVLFHASGGRTPYVYSKLSGVGSINSSTGDYHSTDASPGTGVAIKVTDFDGYERTATIGEVVNPPTPPLTISPSTLTVERGSAYEFTLDGGEPTYHWEVTQGTATPAEGTSNPFTITFTTAETVKITGDDNTQPINKTAVATITVNPPPLVIVPITLSVTVGTVWTFDAIGGTGGYTYSIIPPGAGNVVGNMVTFNVVGPCTVRVTDAALATADSSVTVSAAPPTLYINPPVITLTRGETHQFDAVNADVPFTFFMESGDGSITPEGLYSASANGTATIKLVDATPDTAYADIIINPPPLVLDATTVTIEAGDSHTFVASGGTTPYTYTVFAGVGTIDAGGLYTSAIPGSATVRVQDNSPTMQTVFASVTVNPTPLTISPTSTSIMAGTSITFTASGGTAGYTFSKLSGVGSVNATTGEYTSPTTGSAVIRVIDSTTPTPLTANADVTVTAPPLQITPTAVNLQVDSGQDFNATGGVGTHVYSVVSGNGSIVPSTGIFTAPATPGPTVVQVRDDALSTSQATITVYARLAISPKPATVDAAGTQTFTATGGMPGYTYAMVSGVGSINPGTGVYSAPASPGSAVVKVTDSIGNVDQATVTVIDPAAWTPPMDVPGASGGQFASLALTSAGWPMIAFQSGNSLKLARGTGLTSFEPSPVTVTTSADGDYPGQFASLALNGADLPRISYYYSKGNHEGLGYSAWTGSSWSPSGKLPGTDGNEVGKFSSLALDASAAFAPRIAYYDAQTANQDLVYAWFDGSWHYDTVDSSGDVGQHASLRLTRSGIPRYPHLAYYDASSGDLKYAWQDGGGWHYDPPVDSAGNVGQYASLQIDGGGFPHIAYYDATNGNLKYVYKNAGGWQPAETIDSAGDVGKFASLALDSLGNPRIAYYDGTTSSLKYASWNGLVWVIAIIDNSADVGQDASLALDPSTDKMRIAYHDTAGKLKYIIQQ